MTELTAKLAEYQKANKLTTKGKLLSSTMAPIH
jgi:hypothetical protein